MKVTLALSKFYSNLDLETQNIDELVEKIGAQLGAVEEVVDLGAQYKGVIIAKVLECRKHEDSDHLNVCVIDDGGVVPNIERNEHGHVQVVCGAPNVREGLTVAWLPPGVTVPETFGSDPLVLEAREIRGQRSNGMLASPKELALGDSHDGILEITEDIEPGTLFADAFYLNDHIIDIENKMFTHRPDCFGLLGIYREIAGIQHQKFIGPEWYNPGGKYSVEKEAEELPLEFHNELPELVPRFMTVPMSNITVKPSPLWLQINLMRAGYRPINNVVDVTNYIMYLTGQPLHAYDYDKVKALDGAETPQLIVRHPRPSEKITLLNGKEIEPRAEAIMIATATKLIGVGGVMGGAETEVDENTKNIILEVATFDMYSIRRTSMAHGLFTDAVSRFNKGQSPLQNDRVLAKAVHEIRELAQGSVAGSVIDDNHTIQNGQPRQWVHIPVPVTATFINSRLGLDLPAAEMKALLENVEFTVTLADDSLIVAAPFWRTDVETREDVVEEIGRLYGFDKLPLALPHRSIDPVSKDRLFTLKSTIREQLASAGANELLTYSFVHGDLLKNVGQNKDMAFQLQNALSPDLQYYRLSLSPSLLDKVHSNIKAGHNAFGIFEIGKAHVIGENDDHGLPVEFDRIAFVFAAEAKQAAKAYAGAPYYEARAYLVDLLTEFSVWNSMTLQPLDTADIADHAALRQMLELYEPTRSAVLHDGERIVGVVGEYKAAVRRTLKLPDFCAGFEVFLSALPAIIHKQYVPLPRFPRVSQDMTLRVQADLKYRELYDFVWDELAKIQPPETYPTLQVIDIYQREDDKEHKNVTFRYSIASYEKTMTDAEVNTLFDAVAGAASEKFTAERI